MPTRLLEMTANVRTDLFTIELSKHESESPCDLHYVEPNHVVAMQRQRLQTFSLGRFEVGEARGDFESIGRLLVLPAGVPLHIRAEGGVTETIRCSFPPATLARITGREDLIDADGIAACLDVKCPRIARLMAQLATEAERPRQHSHKLIDALGTAVVIELARHLAEKRRTAGPRRGGLSRRTHREIVAFTNQHEGAVSLAQLSELTGYSQRHLTRAFKQSTGQTVHEYVAEVRLKRAIELLTDSQMLVKDIATRLGFRSAGAFCIAFARATGESPAFFRKRQHTRVFVPSAADDMRVIH